MIKYFCDPCGKELDWSFNRSSWLLDFTNPKGERVPVKIEPLVSINGTSNQGHICADCIIRVFVDGSVKERVTR